MMSEIPFHFQLHDTVAIRLLDLIVESVCEECFCRLQICYVDGLSIDCMDESFLSARS